MPDYTHTNLHEVEDQAPGFGIGELQSARFAHGALETNDTGVSLMGVKPGKRQGFAHRHENAEEVYVILKGSGRLMLDDELVDVAPLDAIRVGSSVLRVFEAGDEGLEYLAFGPRRQGDGETVQDYEWPEG
jgi:mannose-6-phosphate isomerase-like protein (cupin superfamily)